MQITFLGATQTVTGSKYLLTVDSKKILIDCGLFQGYKELRLRNWDKFPVNPAEIDAVIITHAHIDHTGYLPLLVKNGFRGKIYSSPGTKALCSILLPDSGYLQEEEARNANRYGYSKHAPALPLYTQADAQESLNYFETVGFGEKRHLFGQFSFEFARAGHIIGASFIKIINGKTSLLFTGDIGRPHDPVMRPPSIIENADYIIMESTYGDRLHDKMDPLVELKEVINQTAKRGGSIIIPAFAVGRAQLLLYYIYQLKSSGAIADLPVFLDSPMAVDASEILHTYKNDHHLNAKQCDSLCHVARYTRTTDESKQIDLQAMPKIIISASGMITGGRILHHLKVFLPDYRSTILLTGYQAGGTRGDRLLNGEREIKIHGQFVPVHAHIKSMLNTSAHADYQEMLDWLKNFKRPPKKLFITHGDSSSAKSFKEKVEKQFGWSCVVPSYMYTENL